jgi:hypothetical protein
VIITANVPGRPAWHLAPECAYVDGVEFVQGGHQFITDTHGVLRQAAPALRRVRAHLHAEWHRSVWGATDSAKQVWSNTKVIRRRALS